MDYYAIGQRIRKIRKAQGLSQEQLAERVQISSALSALTLLTMILFAALSVLTGLQ